MRHKVKGGAVILATIVTNRPQRSRLAQPVFNAGANPRKIQGGAAQPVVVITQNDLTNNGGQYRLKGGPAIPMATVTGRKIKGGEALVVYPVDLNGNYDATF